jgi:hypothetical protein
MTKNQILTVYYKCGRNGGMRQLPVPEDFTWMQFRDLSVPVPPDWRVDNMPNGLRIWPSTSLPEHDPTIMVAPRKPCGRRIIDVRGLWLDIITNPQEVYGKEPDVVAGEYFARHGRTAHASFRKILYTETDDAIVRRAETRRAHLPDDKRLEGACYPPAFCLEGSVWDKLTDAVYFMSFESFSSAIDDQAEAARRAGEVMVGNVALRREV